MELKEALAKAVESGLDAAEKTGEFVIDQAPELLQEFYRWQLIENILGILFSALFMYMPFIFKRIMSESNSKYDSMNFMGKRVNEDYGIGATVVSFFLAAIGFFSFIIHLFNLIKLLAAPKIYLIDYMIDKF